jgi:hypothetical protein
MTLLTFNTLKDKLLNGEKQQTIRQNVSYWSKVLENGNKLDIWWLNPRNRHPDCYKMGVAVGTHTIKQGKYLTHEDAVKDGFCDVDELINILMSLHKYSRPEALGFDWLVISWKWIERY